MENYVKQHKNIEIFRILCRILLLNRRLHVKITPYTIHNDSYRIIKGERGIFMNRSRKIMKKLTAAAAASALVLSGTSQVFAASYKETEKAG